MPIFIKTTGLEQYAPGGNARVKILIIGGPGVGKTRWSSFFPDPFWLNCEGGLASIADRGVPYVDINTSEDMADTLKFLKAECQRPDASRRYRTVVIDTLDAYQRKLKVEWMEKNRVEEFTGWEAWGYIGTRMQRLMTSLLNLDMNVIVAVHFKDKVTKDDSDKRETHELMLQLQGEIADTAFNDFDLVGWMETKREVVEGTPTDVRWISFEKTPQKPFLKDRLNVMEGRIPVTFSDNDYKDFASRITSRLDGLAESQDLGVIPTAATDVPEAVVAPTQTRPAVINAEVPLENYDKAGLQKILKDEGITRDADGKPLRGNSLKSEIIEAIRSHRAKPKAEQIVKPPSLSTPLPAAVQYRENAPAEDVQLAAPTAAPAPAPTAVPAAPAPVRAQPTIKTEAGRVNPGTGEIVTPALQAAPAPAAPTETAEQALQRLSRTYAHLVSTEAPADQIKAAEEALESFDMKEPDVSAKAAQALVADKLGGSPIARTQEKVTLPPKPATPSDDGRPTYDHKYVDQVCTMCQKPLKYVPFRPIQMGWIKFRTLLCDVHYDERIEAETK